MTNSVRLLFTIDLPDLGVLLHIDLHSELELLLSSVGQTKLSHVLHEGLLDLEGEGRFAFKSSHSHGGAEDVHHLFNYKV